ncbi:Uncharacterized protein YnbB [Galdieria sulphuraria]|uniref:Aluminum resistance protein n=1 Tax=Galdieria sulphuraria TaxID=130081 RepID=M2XY59_GALSU|nr:aluminum resistance protein [Galdieria sulphuraria]EME28374.1 aluminum resistance protein [Galdieria sulphuraria]GJD12556.1 Uncharacterized protein YnbB [Galdieria sulphuraria]|eukprot:XP_005704894.1 aluminum resistance protein [Galdieria sulphuraria]
MLTAFLCDSSYASHFCVVRDSNIVRFPFRSHVIPRKVLSVRYTLSILTKLCCSNKIRVVDKADSHLLIQKAVESLYPIFQSRDQITKRNLFRLLEAFRQHRVSPSMFWSANGYGHGDLGRETLDQIYASLFDCESALVRLQFFSGTHAIACCLYGILRPGDEWVSLTGPPYETLEQVIGLTGNQGNGSLKDFQIGFRQLDLRANGEIDLDAVSGFIRKETKLVFFQRSCGYAWRKSTTIRQLAKAIAHVKQIRPDIICFVDNCYGEWVEEMEPTHVGADIIAGSLIKNCGGTIVPSGGYIAGRMQLVELAKSRLSAPGIQGGATLDHLRTLYQGLFLSPQFVGEAIKGACLISQVMKSLGFPVQPLPHDYRTDIIQSVQLGNSHLVSSFCESVQRMSPVNSYVQPIAGNTPGYEEQVIFANGTFIDGSTSELSADGPLRSPFCIFTQGGTSWLHWQLVLEDFVSRYNENLS